MNSNSGPTRMPMAIWLGAFTVAFIVLGYGRLSEGGEEPQPGMVVLALPGERVRVISQRIKVKQQIIERLRRGELTLLEAAVCFRGVNAEPPEWPDTSWRFLPGRTDEEKICRQVISWLASGIHGRMPESQAELLLYSMEAELQGLMGCQGTVELLP